MPTKTSLLCLVLVGLALASFSIKGSRSPDLTGFWVIEGSEKTSRYEVKVFEKSGEFHNLYFGEGESIITHRGKYKVLDKNRYQEKVTDLRFNAAYDLLNKEFINRYELSDDKKRMVLSGEVISKNGRDTLRWSHVYKKISVPQ